MAANIYKLRIWIKSMLGIGTPTVPASNDHTDGTWTASDIYQSEIVLVQEAAETPSLYTRIGNAIYQLTGHWKPQATSGIYYQDNVAIGALSGTERLYVDADEAGNRVAYFLNRNASGFGVQVQAASGSNYALSVRDYAGSPIWVARGDGKIGVGVTSLDALTAFNIAQDVVYTSFDGQLMLLGKTNNNKRLSIGFDTTNDIGFLQAYINGVGVKALSLNPNGGNVGVGTPAPRSKLDVVGVITNEPAYPSTETNVIGSFTVDFAKNEQRNITLAGDITLSAANAIGSRGQILTVTPNGHKVLLGTGFVQDAADFVKTSTTVVVWLYCYSASEIGVIFINRA